ncbi:MAG: SDR family NAD(P)-dependent oxidoreductase [Deltaproteobacteria bacterium]|nr:SDR family NAD(P)-dependent oxidoreductase [Deltaproteobacteria bacterium]
MELSPDDLMRCTSLLEKIATDPLVLARFSEEQRVALLAAAGRISRPDRDETRQRDKALRRMRREARQARDRSTRAEAGIRVAREAPVFVAPERRLPSPPEAAPARVLERPRYCYVCKDEYRELHFFYDSMCAGCADFNYAKRFQTASLEGRVAVITGSRLKIGYQATLMMLRAGARVIATTRFPHDAALRFSREADFGEWSARLRVHGLDLRHSPSVENFCRYLDHTESRLDIIINNAAQTVRRPVGFYDHLRPLESMVLDELPAALRGVLGDFEQNRAALPKLDAKLLPYDFDVEAAAREIFPVGKVDADLQQVDLRRMNSWRMRLADVPAPEMLEVQLVNSVAPFILCSQLKPLMLRDRTDQKHIVNVSAMEGVFSRRTKTDKHPHTNMAKAALNMMTLTSAPDYARDGIFMNAVDTGWVTDEDPAHLVERKQEEHDFQPPLDIVDGAARVCDPFFSGLLTGKHVWGKFLKDYAPSDW